jgi:hypothetical protein
MIYGVKKIDDHFSYRQVRGFGKLSVPDGA